MFTSLPGSVTGTIRCGMEGSWLPGCRQLASAGRKRRSEKQKQDIRDITRFTSCARCVCFRGWLPISFPNDGRRIWELIIKRNLNDLEKQQLVALGIFGFNAEEAI